MLAAEIRNPLRRLWPLLGGSIETDAIDRGHPARSVTTSANGRDVADRVRQPRLNQSSGQGCVVKAVMAAIGWVLGSMAMLQAHRRSLRPRSHPAA